MVARKEARPEGRPTKYDPAYCDQVMAFMAQGFSLTAFAGEISVTPQTLHNWREEHAEFFDAVKIGQARRLKFLEDGLMAAKDGPTVTSRIFALKNAGPDEWRDKREVEHSGEMAVTTKEQRDAAVAAAMRADS